MRSLEDIIEGLPADEQAQVAARSAELIAEEKALRHLRLARSYTQQNMAELLDIDQASVCRIEKRSDMLLSTMRSYVEAMGGHLRLVAEFSDGAVEIASFAQVAPPDRERMPKKRKRRLAVASGHSPDSQTPPM